MKKIRISKGWTWLLIAWFVSTALVIVVPYAYCYYKYYTPPPDPEVARTIAQRNGIEPPSWYAILCYLYYDAAQPGETLAEVHQALDLIGPWEVQYAGQPKIILRRTLPILQGEYMEVVVFSEKHTHDALYRWIFVYDEDGRLIEKRCVQLEVDRQLE